MRVDVDDPKAPVDAKLDFYSSSQLTGDATAEDFESLQRNTGAS